MNGICYSLKCIHVPSVLISMLYLMYRYLLVLLKEINNMYQSYLLRAPNQKGIAFKYWGVFIGQLLLRTITRAQSIYQSMLLRGYKGDFYLENKAVNVNVSFVYVIVWCTIFIFLRNYNVLKATGDLFIWFFRESVESTEKYITIFFRCFLYLSSNSSKSIPDPEKEIIQVSKTIS